MTILSSTDRRKLAKLLAMLGSDQSGERDAAGLAANRFIKTLGVTWNDVLEVPALEEVRAPTKPKGDPTESKAFAADFHLCWRNLTDLKPWERDILLNVSLGKGPSGKQGGIIARIAADLRARGRA